MNYLREIIICLCFMHMLTLSSHAQAIFLEEGKNGFSTNATSSISDGNINGIGSLAYVFKGKLDAGVAIGTANLGSTTGSVVAPGLSYLAVKSLDGFNLSLDALYAFYRFRGGLITSQGVSVGATAYQAVSLGSNNTLLPFTGIAYNERASTVAVIIGTRFALGMDKNGIFNFGPSISFSDESTVVSLGLGITFSKKN